MPGRNNVWRDLYHHLPDDPEYHIPAPRRAQVQIDILQETIESLTANVVHLVDLLKQQQQSIAKQDHRIAELKRHIEVIDSRVAKSRVDCTLFNEDLTRQDKSRAENLKLFISKHKTIIRNHAELQAVVNTIKEKVDTAQVLWPLQELCNENVARFLAQVQLGRKLSSYSLSNVNAATRATQLIKLERTGRPSSSSPPEEAEDLPPAAPSQGDKDQQRAHRQVQPSPAPKPVAPQAAPSSYAAAVQTHPGGQEAERF